MSNEVLAPLKWRCINCHARLETDADYAGRPPCPRNPEHKRMILAERPPAEDLAPARLLRATRELSAAREQLEAQAAQVAEAESRCVEAVTLQQDAEARAKHVEGRFAALEAERDAALREFTALQAVASEGEQAVLAKLRTAEQMLRAEQGHAGTVERLAEDLKRQVEAVQEGRRKALVLLSRWRLAFWCLLAGSILSHFLR